MKIIIFGNKNTTSSLIENLIEKNHKPHTLVILDKNLLNKNNIAGVDYSLEEKALEKNIKIYNPSSYELKHSDDLNFFLRNSFDIGLCTGWQRIIPVEILNSVKYGVFGWHGSGFEFPNGRGRSPINWSIRLGLNYIYHNCFKYNEGIDTGSIYHTKKIYINNDEYIQDVINNVLTHINESSINLIKDILKEDFSLKIQCGHANINFPKLSEKDGLLIPDMSVEYARNIVRSCSRPFPGAYVLDKKNIKIKIWKLTICNSEINKTNVSEFVFFKNKKLFIRFSNGLCFSENYEIIS